MARENEQSEQKEQSGPPDAHEGDGHQFGRVAAIAAASGATAYAARKLFATRSSGHGGNGTERSTSKSGEGAGAASLVGAAVSSGWDVAKDTLIPVVEDAATRAGSYLAERAPELVRDVIVPRFITGFEQARTSTRGTTRERREDDDR